MDAAFSAAVHSATPYSPPCSFGTLFVYSIRSLSLKSWLGLTEKPAIYTYKYPSHPDDTTCRRYARYESQTRPTNHIAANRLTHMQEHTKSQESTRVLLSALPGGWAINSPGNVSMSQMSVCPGDWGRKEHAVIYPCASFVHRLHFFPRRRYSCFSTSPTKVSKQTYSAPSNQNRNHVGQSDLKSKLYIGNEVKAKKEMRSKRPIRMPCATQSLPYEHSGNSQCNWITDQ